MSKEFEDIMKYFKEVKRLATPQKMIFLLKIPKEEVISKTEEMEKQNILTYIRKNKKLDLLISRTLPITFHIKNYNIPFNPNKIVAKKPVTTKEYIKNKYIEFYNLSKISKKYSDLTEEEKIKFVEDFFTGLDFPEEFTNEEIALLREWVLSFKMNSKNPSKVQENINIHLNSRTQEVKTKPDFRMEEENIYLIGMCYFNEWTSDQENMNFIEKTYIRINSVIFRDIIDEVKENTFDFEEKDKVCTNYPEWLSHMIETFDWQKLKRERRKLEFVNAEIKKETLPEIISILKEFSILKEIAREKGVENEVQKQEILQKYKRTLKDVLSRERYSQIFDNGMKTKSEDIINYILSNNLWMLGHYGKEVELETKEFTDGKWKPDIVAKNKDGRYFVYELKLPDAPVLKWDEGHKSYFLSSECTKAVAQIENQHQYLIEKYSNNSELTFTKNDQLFVVIGDYRKEIKLNKPKSSELKHFGTIEKVIKGRGKGVQLLRNKFKNVNIIFYDELDESILLGQNNV